ncbi:bromodomain protein [Strigomonas culicis]|uniref:Bromodomain protein n=1 Tax=Strigomonas culicis TaxID=28005 RepID=S9W5I1_9TRYP|nr:bromodomain protein [Strigomonas culicis]|eukprot:EPY34571.1 bromodomain protein [Strigomonas culicis]
MEAEKRPRAVLQKDKCLSFIQKVWDADKLAMFHHPVSATDVPGYYEVVKNPVDLSSIKHKIEKGEYNEDADVEADVALMLANALEFNEKGSHWHRRAKEIRRHYLTFAKECGLNIDDDNSFIPSKKAKDDESTLRKAENKYKEDFSEVMENMKKEREMSIEELRAKYAHKEDESSGDDEDEEDDAEESSNGEDEEGDDGSSISESNSDDEGDSESESS